MRDTIEEVARLVAFPAIAICFNELARGRKLIFLCLYTRGRCSFSLLLCPGRFAQGIEIKEVKMEEDINDVCDICKEEYPVTIIGFLGIPFAYKVCYKEECEIQAKDKVEEVRRSIREMGTYIYRQHKSEIAVD